MVPAGRIQDPEVPQKFWEVYVFFGDEPGTIEFVHVTWGISSYARTFRWNNASDEVERQAEELILSRLEEVEYSSIFEHYQEKDFSLIEDDGNTTEDANANEPPRDG